MSKHKWYNEIVAWASGEEIESSDIYIDRQLWKEVSVPCWDNDRYLFRIKPQPKEPQYLYVTDGAMGVQLWRNKQYQENPGQWNIGKIRLEQDDE